jgi:hypothetical protein
MREEITLHRFTERPAGLPISEISSYKHGEPIRFPLEEATLVILHIGDCSIQIGNIQKKSVEAFIGKVLGIEPPCEKCDDVKAEEIVTYKESQVFNASKE